MTTPTPNPNEVTVTRAQVDQWQRAIGLLDKLLGDPKKGLEAKRMLKEVEPSLNFPELDTIAAATEPVNAKITEIEAANKALLDRIEASESAAKDKEALADFNKKFEAAKKLYGLTDEGADKALAHMKSANSLDVDGACAKIAHDNPPPKVTTGNSYSPSSLNLYGTGDESADVDIQALHKNPTKWFDSTVADMLENPGKYPEMAA